ncbi:MAG: hypothetical protein DU429_02285 [Candidatus Tokpelaia sp.]|nr:MAG: hypothetical protein DU430_05035 [Candidatus Tokpelaia sp.]KAA6207320.1 MAG: hypothetical protein DU429_02285 [Candidatus Tokpelaia sp.]
MAEKPHSGNKIAGRAFSCHFAAYLSCKEKKFVWFLLIPFPIDLIVSVRVLSPGIFQAIAITLCRHTSVVFLTLSAKVCCGLLQIMAIQC